MIIVDGKPYHTGTNVKNAEHEIPLSTFDVVCKNKDGSRTKYPDGQFEAVDEGHAISQYIKKHNLPLASTENAKGTSKLKFEATVATEKRKDVLDPPESVVKQASAPKEKSSSSKKSTSKKGE